MSEKSKKNIEQEDKKWMQLAIKQAEQALLDGEIPIGAVLVHENKVVFKSYNQVELMSDVTAHAEIIAISSAGEHLQSKYLPNTTLYVSLEPCAMCAAAIGWAQISRLVFAATDEKKGFRKTAPSVLHPKCKVTSGVLQQEAKQLLDQFFLERRKKQ